MNSVYDKLIIGTEGLVSYWPMDESAAVGSVDILDKGRINNFDLSGGTGITRRMKGPSENLPNCWNMSAAGQGPIGGASSLLTSSNLTVEFWCLWNGSGYQSPITKVGDTGNCMDWVFQTMSGTNKMNAGVGTASCDGNYHVGVLSNTSVSTTEWQYWAFTVDGVIPRAALRLNGIEDASSTATSGTRRGSSPNSVRIGWYSNSYAQYWNGKLAGIAVYNRVLNDREFSERYAVGSGRKKLRTRSGRI